MTVRVLRSAPLCFRSARAGRWAALALLCASTSAASAQKPAAATPQISVTVHDENAVAVPAAEITLVPKSGGVPVRGQTDAAGGARFPALAPGVYELTVEKEGFYPLANRTVDLTAGRRLEIALTHEHEFRQRVEVRYTPPIINPQQTAAVETLSARDVLNIPYSTNRDYRNVLPLIPGVTPSANGQFHINGSSSSQIYERLDGFDVSEPVTGLLDLRVNPDAIRSIDVIGSRLPADLGLGSGEALSLDTATGDNYFRFKATDFIPSFQNRKGLHIEAFTPRFTFSGPIRKGKAWFYDAGQGEYDLSIVQELPAGADEAPHWRWSNLLKSQIHLNATNQLTGSFLVNRYRAPRNGLDALDPLETTTNLGEDAYFASVKDLTYLPGGSLLDWGFSASQFGATADPRGSLPWVIRPEGTSGNYFEASDSTARRFEAIANLALGGFDWHGRHQLRFGTDLDRITYRQSYRRGSILIYREDGTLDRQATFAGSSAFHRDNVETAGYAEDGWQAAKRLFVNAGLRFDWDEILRRPSFSPRLAADYMLSASGNTKLSAGIGLAYPATNLALVSQPLQGQRMDLFYASDGVTPLGPPVVTTFVASPSALAPPRFLNWSAGLEHLFPRQIYLDLEYLAKRGANGFDYQNVGAGPAPGLPSGAFVLRDDENDVYDAFRATVRYPFHRTDMIMVSYTRSRARTSTALAPSFDSLLFSPQLSGPLPWDSPNRLLSWGWLPLIYKFQLPYVLDWRTGVPFSVVNQNQLLVGQPGSRRFPDFFSLNLFLERRFALFGYEWDLRGGYDNITNRKNATVVVNNIDSPLFLTFEGVQGRAFTGRLALLGRK